MVLLAFAAGGASLDRQKSRQFVPYSHANSLSGQNSAGSPQILRPFKGIICDDISEFESYMLSQPVRL
jgi:hypothetical protein